MTIPQAKPVGKLHKFFAIDRLFLKRHQVFKAAEFFQSGRVFLKLQSFLTKKLPSALMESALTD